MTQTPVEIPVGRPAGGRMDDVSLQAGRNGALLGAVVGLLLGVTVWEHWLILVIVLSFYGALVGAVAGVGVGLVTGRR